MIDQGPQPLASWYADPKMPSRLRYWDGRVWTEHVAYAPDPGHPANKDAGGRGDPGDAPGWQDLAANRPGSAARHKALELRQAAPIKTFVARVLNVHTDERGWRIGADGEEKVAMRLQRVGEGWCVLHVGASLVIGSDENPSVVLTGEAPLHDIQPLLPATGSPCKRLLGNERSAPPNRQRGLR
jgi:hypothetical protein